eukprot:5356603-Pyramimonas_sp.AAC.1
MRDGQANPESRKPAPAGAQEGDSPQPTLAVPQHRMSKMNSMTETERTAATSPRAQELPRAPMR